MTSIDFSKLTKMTDTFDLSFYKKTTDILSLRQFMFSQETQCNIVVTIVPNSKIDFLAVRNYIGDDLITSTITKEDLIKLENCEKVISYSVAKPISTYY